tara:strand:- start:23229 stop:24269 length:1041 start_codon:yes stop_codon:yes gene_type:complete
MPEPNANWDEITAVVRENFLPGYEQNVFEGNFLLNELAKKKKTYDGGSKIEERLVYGTHTSNWMAEFGQRFGDGTPENTRIMTVAEYEPVTAQADVVISLKDDASVRGAGKMLDLIEAKLENAKESMQQFFSEHILGEGSTNVANSCNSMYDLIEVDDATVGGIDASAVGNTWWKSQNLLAGNDAGNGNALFALTGDDAYTLDKLSDPTSEWTIRKVLAKIDSMCKFGVKTPDLYVVPQNIWDCYEQYLTEKQALEQNQMGFDGFDVLKFRSNAKVIADPNAQDGKILALNTNYLKLRPHQDFDFVMGDFEKVSGYNARSADLTWIGNVTCNNRRTQGIVTGMPTS